MQLPSAHSRIDRPDKLLDKDNIYVLYHPVMIKSIRSLKKHFGFADKKTPGVCNSPVTIGQKPK